MEGTKVVEDDVFAKLLLSTVSFNPSGGILVQPVSNAFTPSPDLTFADMVLSTWPGSDPLACDTGNAAWYRDPVTGDYLLRLLPPAGGWSWPCTGTPTPAEDVNGICARGAVSDVLIGFERQVPSVNINATGQLFEAGNLVFRVPRAFFGKAFPDA